MSGRTKPGPRQSLEADRAFVERETEKLSRLFVKPDARLARQVFGEHKMAEPDLDITEQLRLFEDALGRKLTPRETIGVRVWWFENCIELLQGAIDSHYQHPHTIPSELYDELEPELRVALDALKETAGLSCPDDVRHLVAKAHTSVIHAFVTCEAARARGRGRVPDPINDAAASLVQSLIESLPNVPKRAAMMLVLHLADRHRWPLFGGEHLGSARLERFGKALAARERKRSGSQGK